VQNIVVVLAACMVVWSARAEGTSQSAATGSGLADPDLGVWKRFIDTPWKEYGTDGSIQHVLFTLTAPDVVTITVRTDLEVRGRVIVRLKGDRTGRYCPVRDGKETCDATIVFDDRSVTFSFDDPQRLPERAVLATRNMFVHSRKAEGVKFEQETYASDAFDQSAAVRQAAHDSMQRYKRGVEEVQRRRAAKGKEPPSE
jgi:hypothetical protein